MKREYELIQHSKIRHLNIFTINILYRNFHMHNDFELLIVLDGEGNIRIKNDNFEVKFGDAILINPGEMHEFEAQNGELKLIIIQFSRHFLNDYFPLLRNTSFQTHRVKSCYTPNNYAVFLQDAVTLAKKYICAENLFALHCVQLLTHILMSFYENLDYEILNENEYQERKKRRDRVNRISAYIDENYLYPIRLQDIASLENISTTHLSHFFTDNFGVTFQEYLNDKRLEQALRIAGSVDYSLAALSELSGFSDPKYLNKAFTQKFGYSFHEYKNSVNKTTGKPISDAKSLQNYHTKEESLAFLEDFSKNK